MSYPDKDEAGSLKDTQAIKFLRFIDPNDSTKVIALQLVDTGLTAGDGAKIYALGMSGGGAATLLADVLLTAKVIAGGASFEGDVIDLQNVQSLAVTLEALYHAAATAGISVEVLTSYDNTTWDTVQDPWALTLEPSFLANVTRVRTTTLDSGPRYAKLRVTNLDGVNAVTVTANWIIRK